MSSWISALVLNPTEGYKKCEASEFVLSFTWRLLCIKGRN
jgi:hypothetical protein